MKLKARLSELQGRNVKIGGSNGFIYCGEAFPGLETLLDEIGEQERWRVSEKLVKAQRIWDERDSRWEVKVANAASDLRMFMLMAAEKQDEIDECKNIVKRAERQINRLAAKREAGTKRLFMLRRLKNRYFKRAEDKAFELRDAERGIKRCESLTRTYAEPKAKERQFKAWKRSLDNYTKEYNHTGAFSQMEILEEYGSWFGGRIIILPSSIEGPYWDVDECKRDMEFQLRIAKVRAKHGIKPYVFE